MISQRRVVAEAERDEVFVEGGLAVAGREQDQQDVAGREVLDGGDDLQLEPRRLVTEPVQALRREVEACTYGPVGQRHADGGQPLQPGTVHGPDEALVRGAPELIVGATDT